MQSKLHLNDLHVEIIQEIFHRVTFYPLNDFISRTPCSESSSPARPAPYAPHYRSRASPFAISHVCKHWRNIALGFPHLWTHLFVIKPKASRLIQLAKEWINRAEPLPLYLSFHEETGSSPSATKLIVHLFVNYAHRCKYFEMDVQTDLLKLLDMRKIHLQFPCHLEYLNLHTHDPLDRLKTRTLLNVLFTSPKLHTVALNSTTDLRHVNIAQCAANLKELALLMPLRFAEISSNLFPCQNLSRLVLNKPPMRYLNSPEGILLPRLTHLSATMGPRNSLSWLIVPSLTELEIIIAGGVCWNTVGCMLEKSGAKPKILRLLRTRLPEDIHFSKTEERSFLQTLRNPFLQELQILEVEQYVGVDTLKFLTLPKLIDEHRYVCDGQRSMSKSEVYLCDLETCFFVFLPTTRIVDVWHELEMICRSRVGSDWCNVRDECIQFSEDSLELSLFIIQDNCRMYP